jgi:hypothetical protein
MSKVLSLNGGRDRTRICDLLRVKHYRTVYVVDSYKTAFHSLAVLAVYSVLFHRFCSKGCSKDIFGEDGYIVRMRGMQHPGAAPASLGAEAIPDHIRAPGIGDICKSQPAGLWNTEACAALSAITPTGTPSPQMLSTRAEMFAKDSRRGCGRCSRAIVRASPSVMPTLPVTAPATTGCS